MAQKIRPLSQGIFFLLFLYLIFTVNIKIWLMLTAGFLILTFFIGRAYCGYACPIMTTSRVTDSLNKKANRKLRKTPEWIKHPAVKILALLLFLGVNVLSIILGITFPWLLVLLAIALVLLVLYEPSIWHKYICPFGTVFSLSGRVSFKHMGIDKENCNSCGACEKSCPSGAIYLEGETEKREIEKKYCLLCFRCQDKCKKEAIGYGI